MRVANPQWCLPECWRAKGSFGYNAASEAYVNLIEMDIFDSTKVTRSALRNAASIVSLILTADVMIAELPGNTRRDEGDGNVVTAD